MTLLPRHWEWLASQSGGASVVLRKLVEQRERAGRLQASARQAVDVVEARVQVGEGRLAELLDAQATLTQAEASLVTARANRAQAAVDVALASGVVDSGAFVVAPAR